MDVSEADVDLLKQGNWFGGLPPALQEQILERSVTRSYDKGQFLIHEGAPARAMHAVLEGKVRVTRLVGDGREMLIHIGESGSWLGDYAVLARAKSVGSIVADTPVRALLLSTTEFERIVRDEPRHFRCFAELLFARYADLFRYLGEAQGLAPEDWLRVRLLDLVATRRLDNPKADPRIIAVSQAELATMVGVSRQTLSSLLLRLQERQLVKIGFRSIRVLE